MLRLGILLLAALAVPAVAKAQPRESAELRELRLLEEELFGPVRGPEPARGALPSALSSELRPEASVVAEGGRDLRWLQGIALPDLPLRWDERVVRYLELFRNDPRGQRLMRAWYQRLGRYEPMIEAELKRMNLPLDLRCVALAESGFDPNAGSSAGAVGMWQFIETTGAEYGLERTHWVDERRDPIRATAAAGAFLGQLYERLGSWELALSAYNMGYGALIRAVRKYNTNDYAVLSRIEAGLPFETTNYVAKILACGVVLRNPERFGLDTVEQDPPLELRAVEVKGGLSLGTVASALGMDREALATLNPELRRGRTPPSGRYDLRIPADKFEAFSGAVRRLRGGEEGTTTHVVRFGETLDDLAFKYRTTSAALRDLNELAQQEPVGPGTALLVPDVRPRARRGRDAEAVATVPDREFSYRDRRRVFYRSSSGDQLADIARFFHVTVDELRTWNHVDAAAPLPDGLLLQIFAPAAVELDHALVLAPEDVTVLPSGSDAFFDYHERQRGRVRFRYTVREGDTLAALASRYGLAVADLSRINHIGRRDALTVGQEIIIYCPPRLAPPTASEAPLAVAEAAP